MELTKKAMLSSKKVALNTTSNKFLTIDLTMILIVLIRIQKYFALLLNKKKFWRRYRWKPAIHSRNYISLCQKTFSDSILESNNKRYGTLFCTRLALSKYFSPVAADEPEIWSSLILEQISFHILFKPDNFRLYYRCIIYPGIIWFKEDIKIYPF